MVKDYFDNPDPIAYWSEGLLDFTTTCTNSIDDVPIWNMNITYLSNEIGIDNIIYKRLTNTVGKDYKGIFALMRYYQERPELNKIGIIHYTNNTVSNFYGEGFYKNSFKLKLPTLLWGKKQFGGPGLGDEIGYTFVCGNELKKIDNKIRYYDLVDQEEIPTIVGKVLIDNKVCIIEDAELITAMSIKSNRNFTLPRPKLSPVEAGICPTSSVAGAVKPGESLHISYLMYHDEGLEPIHYSDFVTVTQPSTETAVKDVLFEFPKISTDSTYSEFPYLKGITDTSGLGWKANNILLLWQKTGENVLPSANEWKYYDISNYVGTGGCIQADTKLKDSFELHSETIIVDTSDPTFTVNYDYTLNKKPIGKILVSLNGLIIKEATSLSNVMTIPNTALDYELYKDEMGDYFFSSSVSGNGSVSFKLNQTKHPGEFTKLKSGDILQFYYLVGISSTTNTVTQQFITPVSIPNDTPGDEGIYFNTSSSKVAIELNNIPNSNTVYIFYNGQIISSNNYSVYPTGADRRIELNFTPVSGSKFTIFYLDNTAAGSNPQNDRLTSVGINDLRVYINYDILDFSKNTVYNLNDKITIPLANQTTKFTFGDETFFFGNIETDIKATIFKTYLTCNVLPNRFVNSQNPTFNPNEDKAAFTELGIYDSDNDLVAIGKFSEPLQRKLNSDVLIIQATLDF
jgi:hypothetical protein